MELKRVLAWPHWQKQTQCTMWLVGIFPIGCDQGRCLLREMPDSLVSNLVIRCLMKESYTAFKEYSHHRRDSAVDDTNLSCRCQRWPTKITTIRWLSWLPPISQWIPWPVILSHGSTTEMSKSSMSEASHSYRSKLGHFWVPCNSGLLGLVRFRWWSPVSPFSTWCWWAQSSGVEKSAFSGLSALHAVKSFEWSLQRLRSLEWSVVYLASVCLQESGLCYLSCSSVVHWMRSIGKVHNISCMECFSRCLRVW